MSSRVARVGQKASSTLSRNWHLILFGCFALLLMSPSGTALFSEMRRQMSADVRDVWESAYHVVTNWEVEEDRGPIWPIRLPTESDQGSALKQAEVDVSFWYYMNGKWHFSKTRHGGDEVTLSLSFCLFHIYGAAGVSLLTITPQQELGWLMPLVRWLLEGSLKIANKFLSLASGLDFEGRDY